MYVLIHPCLTLCSSFPLNLSQEILISRLKTWGQYHRMSLWSTMAARTFAVSFHRILSTIDSILTSLGRKTIVRYILPFRSTKASMADFASPTWLNAISLISVVCCTAFSICVPIKVIENYNEMDQGGNGTPSSLRD